MQLTDTLSHNTCSVNEENFRLHVEKVVVTVTTTFKSGGEILLPSHTKLRLCTVLHSLRGGGVIIDILSIYKYKYIYK